MRSAPGSSRWSAYPSRSPSRKLVSRRAAASSPGVEHALRGVRDRLVEHARDALVAVCVHPVHAPRRRERVVPALRAPRPAERCEHLVGITRAVAHGPRRHGVRRAGRHALDAVGERVDDAAVTVTGVRRGVVRHVHLVGPDLTRHPRDDRGRWADAEAEPSAQGLVQRAQGGGQPGPTGRARAVPQDRVEDEQAEDRAGAGGRPQGRVVPQPQVTSEPHDRGHSTTLRRWV